MDQNCKRLERQTWLLTPAAALLVDVRMSLTSGVREHRSLVLGSAVMLPLLVCAALSGFRETVASATAVLVLVLLVVVAAATGDRVAGIVAALSSGAWFDFLPDRADRQVHHHGL